MTEQEKLQLRQKLRKQRKSLGLKAQQQAAEKVAEKVIQLPEFINNQHIAYYLAQEGELNPAVIINAAQQSNKQLYLPVLNRQNEKALTFYAYHLNEPLQENRYGIPEPVINKKPAVATETIDLVLMPLVSFDSKCNRIGRGAGYYDRTFAFLNINPRPKKPILIGLAYEFQKADVINSEPWDIALDAVITEDAIYWR